MSEGRSGSPAMAADENGAGPPPFHPLPSSHASPGVHSVVPDLMRVYESLTKTGHDSSSSSQQPQQSQEAQYCHQQQQQQQHQQQQGHPPDQMHVQAPAQHVNYAFITSEEQYRQLYQHQSGDPSQMPPQHSNAYIQVQSQHQNQMATSLPFIPAPYGATTISAQQPLLESIDAADKSSGSEEGGSTSRSSSRTSLRRKRPSTSQQQEDVEQQQESSSSSVTSKSKGRKKAKETDGRWSKRFTWPDELHRDFVSAVFDVGLKHSSPSTVLEHMPKHPQITSERIKSHLQKYRMHRVKSKQEFMSSYEATLKKFKGAGGIDPNVKTLTNGEAAAHLSHSALTDVADPSSTSGSHKKGPLVNGHVKSEPGAPQPPPPFQGAPPGGPPPGQEALMLPKLTEAEKASPIGASMGYLLGLFFSLKKQLLTQRAMNGASVGAAPNQAAAPTGQHGVASDPHPLVPAGPVTAVYNSFVGSAAGSGGGGAGNPIQAPVPPMTAPLVVANASMDWSSSTNPPSTSGGVGAGGDHGPPPPGGGAGGPNPVAVQTGSTRTNLEASSMMKREMQNQMAFQNKMRALKQQELNKYKNVMTGASSHHQPGGNTNTNESSSVGYKQPHEGTSSASQQQQQQQQQQYMENHTQCNKESGPLTTAPADAEHHQGQHTPHPQDPHDGDGAEGGDTNAQGAGETAAAARAREPSFSMGNSDDFWNADVMDEQLFEFLMNN